MTIEKKLHRTGPYADLFSQGVQVGNSLISPDKSVWMTVVQVGALVDPALKIEITCVAALG